MEYVRLGKTDLLVSRVAFGAMRLTDVLGDEPSALLVRKAYEYGINFFDTSRRTPESEKLLGDALYDIRKNVILSTSTDSKIPSAIISDLEASLMTLHTDSLDLFQLETEKFVPLEDGADKVYETLSHLKKNGKIKHFGIVTTNYETALKAVESNLYETIQFPFSIISPDPILNLVEKCKEKDVGFIAMQPLCGGVIQNIPLAYGFLNQFEHVSPIWGIKTLEELEQIIYFNEHPPVIDEKFNEDAARIKSFFN